MTQIKKITDKQGNDIYLRTHTKAVVDNNGNTVESRLQAMQDEINAKQLEVGAVPSDLTPTNGSTNWVTSGGVYNFESRTQKTETMFTLNMEQSSQYGLGATNYISDYGSYVIPCEVGDIFILQNSTTSSGAFYGWLTDSYTPPSGKTNIPYVEGTSRIWLNKDTDVSIVAPDNAAYLALNSNAYWKIVHTYNEKIIEIVNNKADKEYVDEKLSIARYDMVQLNKSWQTNDSNYIYATTDGNDTIINIISAASYKRCGIDISDIKVGESVYVYFSSIPQESLVHPAQIVIGVGKELGSTYINVGTFKNSFFFTKTSKNHNYLYTAANSYWANFSITLKDFKIFKVTGFSELDTRISKLESYNFQPSSYIPFKERYERYMTISGTQGSTIYDKYFVQAFNKQAKISIYDLETKTKIQDVTLPAFRNSNFHNNTISFSGTKYDDNDDFPLLYMCAGYVNPNNTSVSEVYVIRIVGQSGNYTSELVQTINLAFGRWTEFVCDPVRNRAWINGSGIAKYICVAIPDTTESDITIDINTHIVDKFETQSFLLGTTTNSSGQGRFFYHNRIYWVSGVPQFSGEGEESLYVVVDNVLTHCTEAVVPLMNYGLTGEPEGCFIWNDDFYIAYSSAIMKLIQN